MVNPFSTFINGLISMDKKYLFVNNKSDNQSGGNIYNAKIGESLEKLGCEVTQTKDIYAENFKNSNYIIILDSIVIDEDFDLDGFKNENAYFLIHLWPSFNKEIEKEKRTRLIQKQKEICQKFNLIFAGEHSRDQCRAFYNGDLKKHFVIPPGVSSGWKKREKHSSTAINFLMIGNLCRRKRQLDVIEAISSLNFALNLTLIGRPDETDYSDSILLKINSCRDKIILHQELECHRMNNFILDYDAIISFSEEENNSIALIESIASGIPIITTPTGNYKTYRNHHVGCVLESFDVCYLTEAIIKMHSDASFYEQQCDSVRKFKINSWSESSTIFLEL